ncbi:hypothetical protein SAMN06265380_102129 [Ruegeria faecimaris]|uniref:Uncharacterized protein n=1 Tax=Ruegeria faecimaris TaxID=686389 RepID=A0A521C4N2_9RHOB|nr:hypothetical protein SAMN06265380_102129 [Ruegeria faecimaris]
MIEMTTNPAAQSAILRAHEARGKAVLNVLKWIFGSR